MATAGIRSEPPLVVIVGPTASGKTALAIRLAKAYNGEVISADSRAIYSGLSIGTAKPTIEERQGIPHWGIDIALPNQRFTAADFKQYALDKIAEISGRGKLPILVGGTGLYVDALLYDFSFSAAEGSLHEREALMEKSLHELHEYCHKNNIKLPENEKNKRYVVAAILRNGQEPKRNRNKQANTIVVGITTEKEILRARIEARAKTIIASGVITEAEQVAKRYGWESEAMTGNIYPLVRAYLNGALSEEEMKQQSITKDWRLAKRQMTWFRRNEHIHWGMADELYTYVARRLDEPSNL